MHKTLTIAKRELTALFFSPIAYVVLALFGLGVTLMFFASFGPGQPATMRTTFEGVVWLMILLVPAISMRLVSEELASGTVEPLMTAPVTDTQVIVGKWLGALTFFAVLLLPVAILIAVLEMTADPDWGPILTGLLGLLLVGGLYLAIGTFASSLTENQIIAFILTVFIICLLTIMTFFLARTTLLNVGMREAMLYLNVNARFENFSKGLIEVAALIYFASGIALFLFMAVKLLESKRWR